MRDWLRRKLEIRGDEESLCRFDLYSELVGTAPTSSLAFLIFEGFSLDRLQRLEAQIEIIHEFWTLVTRRLSKIPGEGILCCKELSILILRE